MTKLSNAKKTVAAEIILTDKAADAVAATLVKRTALDASDKRGVSLAKSETFVSLAKAPRKVRDASDTVVNMGTRPVKRTAVDISDLRANDHAFAGIDADYSLESMVPDVGATPAPVAAPVESDPLAPYANEQVKLSYMLQGMTLDIGTLYLGSQARDKATEFANNKRIKDSNLAVGIFCATSGTLIMKVLPMSKGKAAPATPRQTSPRQTSTVVDNRIILTEEEKAWLRDYDAAVQEDKELDAFYAKWHKDYAAAVKANEKFDQETAARLAKLLKATMRHPDPSSKEYQDWLILTSEEGGTCVELNHNRDVLFGGPKANFGWRQKADRMEEQFNMLLIGQGRQCKVSMKRGLSDAFRLIPREDAIPAGWINISKKFESEYSPE